MKDFLKYCLYCFGIFISGAWGENPEGLTWKTATVGTIVFFVLIGVSLLSLYVLGRIIRRFRP